MLYAVIMAGGRGKRFWPKSRIDKPKQILKIIDLDKSMIRITLDRIIPLIPKENVQIVTNITQVKLIKKELPELSDENFVIEPAIRNTAACIGLSAILLKKKNDPDAVMVVLPADHVVKDKNKFLDTIKSASKVAKEKEALVTCGIKPTFASTGYGYIHVGSDSESGINIKDVFKVKSFIEKPDDKTAEEFFKSGEYFWNSGMFIWKVSAILKAFEVFMPKLYNSLLEIEKIIDDDSFNVKLKDIYSILENKSIDYGVMEPSVKAKAKDKKNPPVYLVRSNFRWNDVGSWRSLEDILPKDENGNVKLGKGINLDVKDSIIISNDKHLVAAINVKDLIIVHTDKATLVCNKKDAEEVKKLLEIIEKEGLEEYL